MRKIFSYCVIIAIALISLSSQHPGKINKFTIAADTTIIITQKSEMPPVLKEISGITSIDENHLACIQDEKGILFIYNLIYDSIEKEIPFHGSGDFEGIARAGKDMYAIRSNGILYSIEDYNSDKPIVTEIKTWLTVKQDVEGLCYDRQHNRLLIAIKGKDPVAKNYKGIYEYNLHTHILNQAPVLRIKYDDPVWNNSGHKMQPSDLAVDPLTGDIYILEGETPSLLIMSPTGIHKKLYYLDSRDFRLPEGIAFSKEGQLFICNEGGLLAKGNILEVVLNDSLPVLTGSVMKNETTIISKRLSKIPPFHITDPVQV
jgi:uncharacterized protein YjiK